MPSYVERASVRLAVDAPGHAAHDDEARAGELAAERASHGAAVGRAGAGADDRDRGPGEQLRVDVAAQPEDGRRIVDRPQERRIRRLATPEPPHAHAPPIPTGDRYESASARCSGSTASAPARAATVRATRATRARPRPESGTRSTARSSSAEAASVRRRTSPSRSRSRAAIDACPDRGRRLSGRRRELLRARPRHRDDEVEAVEQRPRDLLAVARDPLRAAGAVGGGIAAASARAQVHRRDETKAGRKERMPTDPRDRDDAVLEGLSQRLEHRPRELRQLVEQQDAAMREARLSGPWHRAAADDRRRRGAVMRRPERRREDDRPPCRQRSRRPSGSASPRAPRPASAAAGCPAAAGRASSCPFPAAPP